MPSHATGPQLTRKGATQTARGLIPHYQLDGMELPVKLIFRQGTAAAGALPATIPDREPTTYIYVLPGGYDYYPV